MLRQSIRFFSVCHNQKALTSGSLLQYFNDFNFNPPKISKTVKARVIRKLNPAFLTLSPVDLIATPLPDMSALETKAVNVFTLPEPLTDLAPLIARYQHGLIELLNSELAQRGYEIDKANAENVSEREHALQSLKIAYLLGMPLNELLALGFHDVARWTNSDVHYANRTHHIEGDTILSPMGLHCRYSHMHALAKWLLLQSSPQYKNLISPVSQVSMMQQAVSSLPLLNDIPKQFSDIRPAVIYLYANNMLKRLIDDFSKVPQSLLNRPAEYFSDQAIGALISQQMSKHTQRPEVAANPALLEQQLNNALTLMNRTTRHELAQDDYQSRGFSFS